MMNFIIIRYICGLNLYIGCFEMPGTMSTKSDQLIDVLKQIQARKNVKPEDATKALQQYYKVQEHIKSLKSEIELFKANQEKKVCHIC